MGAGKTSIGRKLARRLDLPFADTDAAVVREHGPIDALFRDRGEPEFRRLERAAVQQALASGGVVALGGGAVLDPATRDDLTNCTIVLLTVAETAVADRLAGSRRPLLTGPLVTDGPPTDRLASWRRIAAERAPVYAALADLTVDTSHRPVSGIVEELAAALQARGAVPAAIR
ncbi:shikimate kinase [uncultured Amnibacterium sp.]|uniref:shikimate kinase n=1 Tax=uncultured Amnibacterium sp. TaxID=1631851 RepID=UPI0035CC8854